MAFSSNSGDAASYAERVERHVPGLRGLHRMTGIILAETVPENGRLLVLGAGGGLELLALSEMQPDWTFHGVDPSAEMIEQARVTLGKRTKSVSFHHGYIHDAPDEVFDGAICLLTLHFLPRKERLDTVRELRRRLKPGAPFVLAHHSFPQSEPLRDLWLRRNAALLVSGGTPAPQAENGIAVMKQNLPAMSPEEDEALLLEAGFCGIQMFYAAFTFKGWVCYNS